MNIYEQKILDGLKKAGLLNDEEFDDIQIVLKDSEGALERTLRERRKLSAKDILQVKVALSDLPAYDSNDLSGITPDLLGHISEEAAQQYKIVPLEQAGKKLKVGLVNPDDYRAQEAIRFISIGNNIDTELYVITDDTFQKILGKYRTLRTQIKEALVELEEELKDKKKVVPTTRFSEEMVKEAPVIKIVAVILKHGVEGKASDIHVEAIGARTRVRFRVYGKLFTSLFLPANIHSSVVSRIKILASLRLDESRTPQDGRFSAEVSGRTIDFRVSTFPTRLGEKVVMRVLDPATTIKTFRDLGITGRSLEVLEEALGRPTGLILVSGPTGSGKSTTLYAALSSIDVGGLNLVSLEDPIEYHIDGVSQSQIRHEIGYTFASGLRHVLRQDPDIIMVGEVRDTETAELVTHAALTGHLVLSTIHTNDAIGVIPRLIDMGVPPFLIPSSLTVAVAQRLLRRLCPKCKVKINAPDKIAREIAEEIKLMSEISRDKFGLRVRSKYELWNSPGCEACSKKGTTGRVGIYEVLTMTKELKKIVYEDPRDIVIKEEALRQGMVTLRQDGIIKALQGVVSMEEVLRFGENVF